MSSSKRTYYITIATDSKYLKRIIYQYFFEEHKVTVSSNGVGDIVLFEKDFLTPTNNLCFRCITDELESQLADKFGIPKSYSVHSIKIVAGTIGDGISKTMSKLIRKRSGEGYEVIMNTIQTR